MRVQNNHTHTKWRDCRSQPLSAVKALWQWHKSLHGVQKNFCNAAACCSSTALHEWNQTLIFSMFAIFAITAVASTPHPYRMYGLTAFDCWLKHFIDDTHQHNNHFLFKFCTTVSITEQFGVSTKLWKRHDILVLTSIPLESHSYVVSPATVNNYQDTHVWFHRYTSTW